MSDIYAGLTYAKNEVVGGVLARAVQHSAGTVRLHAFTFPARSPSCREEIQRTSGQSQVRVVVPPEV